MLYLGMLRVAHNLFASTSMAFDVNHGRDELGRAITPTPGADYPVPGVIQPASPKQIELLPDGAQSNGALQLHAYRQLKACDVTDVSRNGVQTYVRHAGEVWKVWAIEDWTLHAGFNRYILTKYRDVNGNVK